MLRSASHAHRPRSSTLQHCGLSKSSLLLRDNRRLQSSLLPPRTQTRTSTRTPWLPSITPNNAKSRSYALPANLKGAVKVDGVEPDFSRLPKSVESHWRRKNDWTSAFQSRDRGTMAAALHKKEASVWVPSHRNYPLKKVNEMFEHERLVAARKLVAHDVVLKAMDRTVPNWTTTLELLKSLTVPVEMRTMAAVKVVLPKTWALDVDSDTAKSFDEPGEIISEMNTDTDEPADHETPTAIILRGESGTIAKAVENLVAQSSEVKVSQLGDVDVISYEKRRLWPAIDDSCDGLFLPQKRPGTIWVHKEMEVYWIDELYEQTRPPLRWTKDTFLQYVKTITCGQLRKREINKFHNASNPNKMTSTDFTDDMLGPGSSTSSHNSKVGDNEEGSFEEGPYQSGGPVKSDGTYKTVGPYGLTVDSDFIRTDLLVREFHTPAAKFGMTLPALKMALQHMTTKGGGRASPDFLYDLTLRQGLKMDTDVINILLRDCIASLDTSRFHLYIHRLKRNNLQPNAKTWLLFLEMVQRDSARQQVLPVLDQTGLFTSQSARHGIAAVVAPHDAYTAFFGRQSMSHFLSAQDERYGRGWLSNWAARPVMEQLLRTRSINEATLSDLDLLIQRVLEKEPLEGSMLAAALKHASLTKSWATASWALAKSAKHDVEITAQGYKLLIEFAYNTLQPRILSIVTVCAMMHRKLASTRNLLTLLLTGTPPEGGRPALSFWADQRTNPLVLTAEGRDLLLAKPPRQRRACLGSVDFALLREADGMVPSASLHEMLREAYVVRPPNTSFNDLVPVACARHEPFDIELVSADGERTKKMRFRYAFDTKEMFKPYDKEVPDIITDHLTTAAEVAKAMDSGNPSREEFGIAAPDSVDGADGARDSPRSSE